MGTNGPRKRISQWDFESKKGSEFLVQLSYLKN